MLNYKREFYFCLQISRGNYVSLHAFKVIMLEVSDIWGVQQPCEENWSLKIIREHHQEDVAVNLHIVVSLGMMRCNGLEKDYLLIPITTSYFWSPYSIQNKIRSSRSSCILFYLKQIHTYIFGYTT